MNQKPIWTYDVTSANDAIETLKIRRLLQKNSQPKLEPLQRFDVKAEQTLLYLYKNNEAYKEKMDKRVVAYARQILNALLDGTDIAPEDIDALQIEPHLIHEPPTSID